MPRPSSHASTAERQIQPACSTSASFRARRPASSTSPVASASRTRATMPLRGEVEATGIGAFDAVLVIGGNDLGPRSWIEQVAPRIEEIPFIAVTPTVLLPEVQPYLGSWLAPGGPRHAARWRGIPGDACPRQPRAPDRSDRATTAAGAARHARRRRRARPGPRHAGPRASCEQPGPENPDERLLRNLRGRPRRHLGRGDRDAHRLRLPAGRAARLRLVATPPRGARDRLPRPDRADRGDRTAAGGTRSLADPSGRPELWVGPGAGRLSGGCAVASPADLRRSPSRSRSGRWRPSRSAAP